MCICLVRYSFSIAMALVGWRAEFESYLSNTQLKVWEDLEGRTSYMIDLRLPTQN